jgi:hypothetical protein
MCLATVSEQIGKPTTLIQSGWKRFDSGLLGKPKFENFTLKGSRSVPLDEWLVAEGGTAKGSNYTAGFHIFEDEKEKLPSDKRRVYYRKVHARGRDRALTTVVAQEMYVPSDPDAWPPQE